MQYLGVRFLTLRLLIKHNYYITNKTISNVLFSRTVAFLDCSSSSPSEEALQESNNSSSSDSIISTKKTPKQHNSIHSYSKLACLKKIRKFRKSPQRQSIIKIFKKIKTKNTQYSSSNSSSNRMTSNAIAIYCRGDSYLRVQIVVNCVKILYDYWAII